MEIKNRFIFWMVIAMIWPASAYCGWNDWRELIEDRIAPADETGQQTAAVQALTQSEMANALKQALEQGVNHAVRQLGRPGGFLDDSRVRIPMPAQLQWVETSLRGLGQDEMADDFVRSMNSAAEKAVPEVADVFGEAVRKMSLSDAQAILQGPDDAATEYFRRTSSDTLLERMRPIVEQATARSGVTSTYKSMMGHAGGLGSLLGRDTTDLDGYVTRKTLDGLFLMIAEQEKEIRENPVERSTALLQKVFGTLNR